MKIEKVHISNLDAIFSLTKSCAKHLIENEIFQWNEYYPSKEVLKNDIELNQLWKLVENNLIIGIIALTEIEDVEYKSVKWLTENDTNLYIHRLAVHPDYQGKGYAQQLMNFAENYAKEHNYDSIRLDTFSKNIRNQQFYEKRNYIKLESIYFPKQSEHPFYCYEKVLHV
ncbi:ribosomal protein S18 acetylase RimI-like enzyme [Lutibacter oceani]|uniref:Ribosomal protein S18 acetylase RimI-like enzyme n=1 Tax=Lutibacter oceani TaxID=1853311 RepID=A0A3D9S4R7_9FLAO|nr:GNAT family N-acetyltransferase [Lutibacter oceani]REE83552.1 ribosomal protein S18 acetylase RimI-like enzyme [Lutibacter oceani]